MSEEYRKLLQDLETKALCDNMLDSIINLTEDMVLKISLDFYKSCVARSQDYNEDERIYFYCWSR